MLFRRQRSQPRTHVAPACFAIGEIGVSLRTDRPEVREDFRALYHGCQRSAPDRRRDIDIEVRRCRCSLPGRLRYAIHGDGEEIFSHRRPREVMPCIEWSINRRVIESRSEFLQVHSAVLARSDQAILLAGTSGAGKSTLAAGLLSRGWTYLSDEFALIDPVSLRVSPFPKALCIKSGSFGVIDRLRLPLRRGRHYASVFKGEVGYISPSDLDARKPTVPPAVRVVLFPSYAGNSPPRARPISRARATYLLAGHTFNRKHFADRTLSVLSELTRRAECFSLRCSQIDDTCAVVESLVG